MKDIILSGFSISYPQMIKVDEYRQPFLFSSVVEEPQLALEDDDFLKSRSIPLAD